MRVARKKPAARKKATPRKRVAKKAVKRRVAKKAARAYRRSSLKKKAGRVAALVSKLKKENEMIPSEGFDIKVLGAEFAHDHSLRVLFSDGNSRIVDFSPFLNRTTHPIMKKYLIPAQFKKFRIDRGNVVWGRNWDLIFPIMKLYNNTIQ